MNIKYLYFEDNILQLQPHKTKKKKKFIIVALLFVKETQT